MSKVLRIRLWSGVAVLSVALALLVVSLLTNPKHPLQRTIPMPILRLVMRQKQLQPRNPRRAPKQI